MKRIGIITMYYNSENYGGIAQGFALQKYIENLGYDSEIISYQHKKRKIIEKYLLTYILNHANHIHVKIYLQDHLQFHFQCLKVYLYYKS